MTDEPWVMLVVLEAPIDRPGHLADLVAGRVTTRYLKAYWPDRHDGRGEILFTDEPAEARQFASFETAMDVWKTQSKVRPLRPDGLPNRPLTAYTVQPQKLGEATAAAAAHRPGYRSAQRGQ